MSKLPGFVGPSGQLYSRNVNDERTVNLILESGSGTPKVAPTFYSRMGVEPYVTLPGGPIRGMFAQDGRCFVVGGANVCEIFPSQSFTTRGLVGLDANPVTLCSNGAGGHQVFITSQGHGYIFDLNANTLTPITASGFPDPVIMGDFIDGYFVALKGQSNEFHISALEDGMSWADLDVAQVSESSNQLVSLVVQNRLIWLGGSRQTEPWADIGTNNFPFAPVSGTQIQMGVIAPWSVKRCDNTLFFIGQDADGTGIVWRMNGYTPVRISTPAVENMLRSQPRLDDVIAFTLQQSGHLFYVLYLPANDTSWVYDVSTSNWTEWAEWDDRAVNWIPFVGRAHCFFAGMHLIGDRSSGIVYRMAPELYTDTVPS